MSSTSNAWSEVGSGYGFAIGQANTPAARSTRDSATREGRLDCRFQPVRQVHSQQLLGYRAVTDYCDSHQRAIPFSQLMGWAKSRELQAIFQSYRLQEILSQSGANLAGARLFIPVEIELFYANNWSWGEVTERAEQAGILSGQLVWELLESECHADTRMAMRFINEGREFFSRYSITTGATRAPDWELLRLLRPDFLQLPEQMINGCTASSYRRDWVAGAIRLAAEQGIKVLACGVHAKADWDWLVEQGVAGGFGSWLGNPGALTPRREPLV